ncbi:uncharacterized protein LOC142520304 [Primulina tabacum]|uniref:uncharacterized protein LOC142520304 n=1 Tax=Primulina tabacum TaxID=48773 RepID=UPI003F5A1818
MAHTRRTNQGNSHAQGDGGQTSRQADVSNIGTNLITLTPEELKKMMADAGVLAMARKEVSHPVTPPGDKQGRDQVLEQEQEQGQGRRDNEMVGEDEGSSAGSKSPTMAEELMELRQKMKVLEGQLERRSVARAVPRGCPFSDIIVREPLPGNFKSAKVKDYDGNADPEEYLARFENMAMLHCYTDRIKCKVFLTTLVDSAQRWFEGLTSQSISSFEDFQKVFLHHFSSSKKYKKTAFSLFEVKQNPEESLRAYIRRFNRVALDVPTCATETKTTAFTQGLREGEFFKSLTKKVPGYFEDLLSRAEIYINMEEAQKQKRDSVRKEKGDRMSKPEERGQKRGNTGHFSHHVPLKIAREREVQECSRDLAPDHQLSRPEKSGFCSFHKVCHHNTENCKALKGNYASSSIPGPSSNSQRPRMPPWTSRPLGSSARGGSVSNIPRIEPSRIREPEPKIKKNSPPTTGMIKMILGGSTDGDSHRARKGRSRRDFLEVEGARRNEAIISFGPEDLRGVSLPHNDALVIQARVANYDILRVFVDSGSSGYHLEAVETALFGFAGHMVYPEGEIMLPLTLGSQDLKRTVMTSFTVVDSPSSYNIILGRPAMNELRAVASTYHQKIKFPVGARVGEVRGDQPSSQKCYVEAVRADQSRTRKEGKKARVDGERTMGRGEVHFVAEEEQEELTGISPLIAEHQLNILPGSHLVKQKKRHFGLEKDKVIDAEIKELLKAGHIREIQFSTWLSNVVLLGRNVEVYMDNILSKSREGASFISDLEKTFATLMHYGIKLNPAKCIFGVKSGKFLGFIVTDRGIEVNQEKVESVLSMSSPRSVKKVQKLTGRIDFLSRFISRSAHWSYPFFQILRKAQQLGWDEKCEQAFQDLKIHLAGLPVLVKPEPGEKLYVYLSATEYAVSSVLIKEEGTDQKPVYYVSHALRGPELRYSEVEKIALALFMTARKLRPYFLSHQVIVLTNSPLGRIMTHSEVSGRMIKWTVELGEYDIEYKPRVAIKAQALSDFLSEMIQPGEEEVWKVSVDGASSLMGCGVGVVLVSPLGEKVKLALRIDSRITNIEAEYEAVLAGIRAAREVGASRIILYSDSQLITQQIKGIYEDKDDKMLKYLRLIRAQAESFMDWSIDQVPREENSEADALAKMATSLSEVNTREVLHITRLVLSTEEEASPMPEDSWMTPLIAYITNHELPEDKARAQKIKRQAPSYSPATLMKPIWASRPFDQWGMDIVGPFPWVEAEPLAKITEQEVLKFLWKNIVCRFGVPRRIISDNGRQFQGKGITSWCQEMKITQSFTSVAYPQANGQTEVVNRVIVQALKARLQVLSEEIGQTSSRVESYPEDNDQSRAMELDLIEEKRNRAFIRMEAYRNRVMKSYNKKVRIRNFQVGDLVMKKVNPAGEVGKLEARWEGPYKITRRVNSGSFYLEDAQGRPLKRPWNAFNLKKYYA